MTIKTTNRFSIITIVNWDIYQPAKIENDTQNDKPSTSKRQHTISREVKNNIYSQNSLEVLSYLNEKTGRKYRDASHIEARLKDGGTIAECKQIIDAKLTDRYFIDNPKYLNPVTLFRKSHWDKYVNEGPVPTKTEAPSPLTCPRCGRRIVVEADLREGGCVHCLRRLESARPSRGN